MNILPPLRGEICRQYIRCGKAYCRCNEGRLHGPYHYRIWREGDKVQKAYIKLADVATVQAQCAAYKALQNRLRQIRREQEALSRRIARECRAAKRLLRSLP